MNKYQEQFKAFDQFRGATYAQTFGRIAAWASHKTKVRIDQDWDMYQGSTWGMYQEGKRNPLHRASIQAAHDKTLYTARALRRAAASCYRKGYREQGRAMLVRCNELQARAESISKLLNK